MRRLFIFLLASLFYVATMQSQQVVTLGTGTSTSYVVLPGHYGWNRNVYLYKGSEIGNSGYITDISFQVSAASTSLNRVFKVYMMTTSRNELAKTFTWNEIKSQATLVYEINSAIFPNAGWNSFKLDQAFQYNDQSNLLVLIEGTGCIPSGDCAAIGYYTEVSNSSWGITKDNTAPDDNSISDPSLGSSRLNIQITLNNNVLECSYPTKLQVSQISSNSANLSWTEPTNAPSNGYQIYYSTSLTTPTVETVPTAIVTAGNNEFNLTELTGATTYYAWIRSDCGNDVLSPWSNVMAFYTGCNAPQMLTVSEVLPNSVTIAWVHSSSNNLGYDIYYSTSSTEPTNTTVPNASVAAGINSFRIENLNSGGTYYVWIRTKCSNENSGEWYGYTTLKPQCLKPSSLTINQIIGSDVTISWVESMSNPQGYDIYYSTSPTAPTSTTIANASVEGTNTYTILGLTRGLTYYVWIRSNCDNINKSPWSSLGLRFFLPCEATTLPITEGFNTTSESSFPICWHQEFVNGDLSLEFKTSGSNPSVTPYEGSRMIYLNSYNNGSTTTRLVSPLINTTGISSVDLQFMWYFSKLGGEDYYMSEGVQLQYSIDGTTWHNFDNFIRRYGPISQWELIETTLPSAAGNQNTLYVGFLFTSEYGYNIYMDDLIISSTPDCKKVKNIVATNTEDNIQISWQDLNEASSWNIKISTSPIDPETTPGNIVDNTVNTNQYVFTNSVVNTYYYVYIQSDCNGGASEWRSSGFASNCGVVTNLPWVESFELNSVTKNCWTVINNNNDDVTWELQTLGEYANTGNYSYEIYTDDNDGVNDDYLISPQITLTGNEVLRFYSRVRSEYEPNDFEILLSTTGMNVNDFTEVLMPNTSFDNISYELNYVDLTQYTGTVYIAFHVKPQSLDGWYIFIDDIAVCVPSSEKDILTFTLADQTGPAVIDNANHTIAIEVALSVNRNSLVPTITTSEYSTINPLSNVAKDFTNPVNYTVTAENATTQVWTVTVTNSLIASDEKDILAFTLPNQDGETIIDEANHTITINFDWQPTIINIAPEITISRYATISPANGVIQNYTNPISYTVTAEDGTTQVWTVTVIKEATPLGANCDNPYLVSIPASLPYNVLNQTNCGLRDVYDETNIPGDSGEYYDNGEDVLYRLTVTEIQKIKITMDPKGTNYSSLLLYRGCPGNNYIDGVMNSNNELRELTVILVPGEYYLMLDTWTAPDCIDFYDLNIVSIPLPTISEIDIDNVAVDFNSCVETTEQNLIANLPSSIKIKDSDNVEHNVQLTWTISNYNASVVGTYTATGTFELPFGVLQTDPITALEVIVDITTNELIIPEFEAILPLCRGDNAPELPTTSINSVTGTWNPATINTSFAETTTYTFTPSSTANCEQVVTMDITIRPIIIPTFAEFGPYCIGSTPDELPLTSINGLEGTWEPATINTETLGSSAYVFTPNTLNDCEQVLSIVIEITDKVIPTFTQLGPFCIGSVADNFVLTSTNGITGTWAPATISTDAVGTISYTFTPNDGECALPTTMDITINEIIIPTFDAMGPYCKGVTANNFELTSTNSISGTWSPATINTGTVGTTTYTFTPNAGQCAESMSMDITVIELPIVTCPVDMIVTTGSVASFENYSPTGGVFSGTGVNGNSFSAVGLGVGNYSVNYTYTDAETSCVSTCEFNVSIQVGVALNNSENINIYPNPNNGNFTIDFGDLEGKISYQVIDTKASILFYENDILVSNKTKNLSLDLKPGIYYIKLITAAEIYVEKIIVQ